MFRRSQLCAVRDNANALRFRSRAPESQQRIPETPSGTMVVDAKTESTWLFRILKFAQDSASFGLALSWHANIPPIEKIPAILACGYISVHGEEGYSRLL
jgi:hypothetical protein